MSATLSNVGILIIHTLFSFYIYVLLLRLFFQKWGANWYNPLSQFVIRSTEFLVKPVGQFVPGFRGFDLSIVLIALVVQLIAAYIETLLKLHILPSFLGMLVMSIGLLFGKVVNLFMIAIIVSALASWLPALQNNPVIDVIHLIASPWMRLGRRFVPLIAGLDLSPIIVLLVLKVVDWLLFDPLTAFGYVLAMH